MLSLETALEKIFASLPASRIETRPVNESAGRILAGEVCAANDLPFFDNSAMDGYAVRSSDVTIANQQQAVLLRLIGEIPAGTVFSGNVSAGECVRIFTGSPVPSGADAVVMQEDTRVETGNPEEIQILDRARPFENIRLKGEDIKSGAHIGRTGQRVTAGLLNLLGAVGCASVSVNARPVVGVLATGDELRVPPDVPGPGEICESNRAMVAFMVNQVGGEAKTFPIVRDTLAATRAALEHAFTECDLVVTTGGASVGKHDYVKDAFAAMGGRQEFWKVAIKPGKPFVFGQVENKFLFGLPGNPVSAFVTFLMLVRPALLRWQGASDTVLPSHPGKLAEPLLNRGDRRHFVRVRVDSAGRVHSAGTQASHMLHSLAIANGLVDVPPATTLDSGSIVRVMRTDL